MLLAVIEMGTKAATHECSSTVVPAVFLVVGFIFLIGSLALLLCTKHHLNTTKRMLRENKSRLEEMRETLQKLDNANREMRIVAGTYGIDIDALIRQNTPQA